MGVLISAIIPSYNRADFIGQAIHSALEQHVPGGEVEVIVVDDGSTDGTAEVVQNCGNRVRYFWQPNSRQGAARNRGAQEAHGTYLAFLDSDDFWLPGKLATDVQRLRAPDQPAMVYSHARLVDINSNAVSSRLHSAYEGDIFWPVARYAYITLSSVVVRRDAFEACGRFRENRVQVGEDWELLLRIAARWRIGFADQIRTCKRQHPGSILNDADPVVGSLLAALQYALSDPVVATRVRGREHVLRSAVYFFIALNAYANRRRLRSWQWLARSFATWPPHALETRFWGGVARAVLGPVSVTHIRPFLFNLHLMRPVPSTVAAPRTNRGVSIPTTAADEQPLTGH